MYHLVLFAQICIACIAINLADGANETLFGTSPRRDLNFTELANYDGYLAKAHSVTTGDGYILGVFRIPPHKNCSAAKGVILFMHGLYLSGDDCLIPGPGKAHCYVYSDSCYDVWVPNARGNFYSRKHVTYDPDKNSSFWDFSVNEMATYDLPASIDYILNATGNSQLSFVGHSQGVTMLLILCSKQPVYNDKIKVGIGLSVTAWLDHSKFIVIQLQGVLEPILTTATNLGIQAEILKRGGLLQSAGKLLCGVSELSYPLCSVFVFAALGYNKFQITDAVLPVVVGHTPSGTSLKNFNRWGQFKNNGFSEFDYGTNKNLLVYGQAKPPVYDLSKITMKWEFIGSANDCVANVTDVRYLASQLPNVSLCVLGDKTFGHLDFIYGKDIPKYLTPMVTSIIENGTSECI